MFCPQCKAEYRVGFKRCSDCDVELVDHLPPDPPRDVEPQVELVVVRRYLNGFDAGFGKSVLEAAGIESVIRSNDAGRLSPGGFPRGVELLVRSEDAADADEILNAEAGPGLSGQS
jgi:hypothetical protein